MLRNMESMNMNKGKYRRSLFMCFKTVIDEEDNFKPLRRRRTLTWIEKMNYPWAEDSKVMQRRRLLVLVIVPLMRGGG